MQHRAWRKVLGMGYSNTTSAHETQADSSTSKVICGNGPDALCVGLIGILWDGFCDTHRVHVNREAHSRAAGKEFEIWNIPPMR